MPVGREVARGAGPAGRRRVDKRVLLLFAAPALAVPALAAAAIDEAAGFAYFVSVASSAPATTLVVRLSLAAACVAFDGLSQRSLALPQYSLCRRPARTGSTA